MNGAVKDGWTGRERDLASREIPATPPVAQARAILSRTMMERGCKPENAEAVKHTCNGSIVKVSADIAVDAIAKAIAEERERCAAECDKRAAWERAQVATSKTQRERLCFTNAGHALEEAAQSLRSTPGDVL